MADIADPTIAGWVQAGGVVVFAAAVLQQLRDTKRELAPLFKSFVDTLGEVKTTMAALLERERARAERIAAQDAARRTPAGGVPTWNEDDEVTHPIALRPSRGGG